MNADGVMIAELTKTFNVHYHGFINFTISKKHPDMVFMNYLRQFKEFGKSECVQVKNQEHVEDYVKKSYKDTKDKLECSPIVFNKRYIPPKTINMFFDNLSESEDNDNNELISERGLGGISPRIEF